MYAPGPVPTDPAQVRLYLAQELERIARELRVTTIRLDELHVAPTKPREGMIVLADGVDWNPGAGAAFYGYRGGAWHSLG